MTKNLKSTITTILCIVLPLIVALPKGEIYGAIFGNDMPMHVKGILLMPAAIMIARIIYRAVKERSR